MREALLLVRQEITARFEDSNSAYLAYTYFFQEQLRTATCLGSIPRSAQCNLFEACWNLYIAAKIDLLAENKFDSLESIYLLLSLMLTMDNWARALILPEPTISTPPPLTDSQQKLAAISEISNAKLLHWRHFHRHSFQPWAEKNITGPLHLFAPLRLVAASSTALDPNCDPSPAPTINLRNMDEIIAQIDELAANASKLVSAVNTALLEFDDALLPKDTPLEMMYPSPTEGLDSSTLQGDMSGQCQDGMFHIHGILHNVRWLHTFSASRPKRPSATIAPIPITPNENSRDSENTKPIGDATNSSTPTKLASSVSMVISPNPSGSTASIPLSTHPILLPIEIENLIPPKRLLQVRESVSLWEEELRTRTHLTSSSIQLINEFYFRTLTEVLLNDCELSGEVIVPGATGENIVKSPLVDLNNFFSTLYAATFEIAMFCFGQSESSVSAYPFIQTVVNTQAMNLCKVLGSLCQLFTAPNPNQNNTMPRPASVAQSAPRPISAYIELIQDRIVSDYIWRPGSALFSAYNDTIKSYFSYVLSYAGPPHQPRMALHTALTSPGMAERFNQMYRETSANMTHNWDSHNIMFKVLRVGCTLLRKICQSSDMLERLLQTIQHSELTFTFIVTQRLPILVARHIDTMVLCTLFTMADILIGTSSPSQTENSFKAIISAYSSLPTCNDAAVNLIPIEEDIIVESEGDSTAAPTAREPVRRRCTSFINITDFYRRVFLPEVAPILSKFRQHAQRLSKHSPSVTKNGPEGDGKNSSFSASSPTTRNPREPLISAESIDKLAGICKKLNFDAYADAPSTPEENKRGRANSATNRSTLLPIVKTPPRSRAPRPAKGAPAPTTQAPTELDASAANTRASGATTRAKTKKRSSLQSSSEGEADVVKRPRFS